MQTRADAAPSPRYPLTLLVLFAACWLALAIAPWYRQDGLLENLLVFAALPLLFMVSHSTIYRKWSSRMQLRSSAVTSARPTSARRGMSGTRRRIRRWQRSVR